MSIVIKNKENKVRYFLNENTKKSYKSFLLEVDGGEKALERARQNPDIPIYLVGIIQKGDAPNRNGRIYPFDILKKECERYMREEIKDGQSFCELDHPAESTVPELKNAAATMEDIWFKGLEVWGKIKILNAYASAGDPALKARNIVLNNKTLGISSRALGSVYQAENGYDVVEDDLEIICWDLVSRPSTYDANLRMIESVGKKQIRKESYRTEMECFGGVCNLKTSKDIIKEKKLISLTEAEKMYVNILGVEKFLQLKRQNKLK